MTLIAGLSLVAMASGASAATLQLVVGTSSTRANPIALSGLNLDGKVYVVAEVSGASKVRFWLDKPTSASPRKTERDAPYDFSGGSLARANAWDTTKALRGKHFVTAIASLTGGGQVSTTVNFTVRSATAPTARHRRRRR